jgi:hypothetical protein
MSPFHSFRDEAHFESTVVRTGGYQLNVIRDLDSMQRSFGDEDKMLFSEVASMGAGTRLG